MKKDTLKKHVLRMLLEREVCGYDISKELSRKGIKLRSNYVYTVLTEMEKSGVLKSRWADNPTGPRKHLYTLSKHGENEFRAMLKESLDFLMGAFIRFNINSELSPHVNVIREFFSLTGMPVPAKYSRLVVSVSYYDPLVCYPTFFWALSEAFPESSIYVVKPPGVRLYEERPNLTFLDGWRHDMPLKDNFADYLLLEGFPNRVSEEDTIKECLRVLNGKGHFGIMVPKVMIEGKAPTYPFSEFVLKLFYDLYEQDRIVDVELVKRLLSAHFVQVRHVEDFGNLFFYASGKVSRRTEDYHDKQLLKIRP